MSDTFVSLGEEASVEFSIEITNSNPIQTGPMFSGESKLCENN